MPRADDRKRKPREGTEVAVTSPETAQIAGNRCVRSPHQVQELLDKFRIGSIITV